jgi:DNA repair photolyase
VSLGPVLPGLNDAAIPDTLEAAARAGARWAFLILLRLPGAVEPVFVARLREAIPLRANKLVHAIEDMRGGKHHDARFGARMRGQGPRWAAIEGLFAAHCKRLGLAHEGEVRKLDALPSTFRRPKAQLELW